MTDNIDQLTKQSIDEMSVDTLRRVVLSLQEKLQMREAHNEAIAREHIALMEQTMRKVIIDERRRFDVVKFLRWFAARVEEYFRTFYKE